jgi:hypothetical protein
MLPAKKLMSIKTSSLSSQSSLNTTRLFNMLFTSFLIEVPTCDVLNQQALTSEVARHYHRTRYIDAEHEVVR